MPTVRVLGDVVLVLYLGEAVEYARRRTFQRPAHPYSLALLSASPGEAERRNIRHLALQDEGASSGAPSSRVADSSLAAGCTNNWGSRSDALLRSRFSHRLKPSTMSPVTTPT